MTKIYLVKEVQGSERFAIGACPTLELAKRLVQENENIWNLEDCEITFSKWSEMEARVYGEGLYNYPDIVEKLIELYPEYPVSDIEKAYAEYSSIPYVGTEIEEITLYNDEPDIIKYGIDNR